ncbi:MAG: hypothetical protein HY721_34615 [Planctomycetes bacterium]|nr:hypothetical protein [Planctomycetota bacterium]
MLTLLGATQCSRAKRYTEYRRPKEYILERGPERTDFNRQTFADVRLRDQQGCARSGCHEGAGDPHPNPRFAIACVDCHGGHALASSKEEAHPRPRFPHRWPTAANPERTYTLLNDESWEWVRFVNPGDLRVADVTCGPCHADIVLSVSKSLMTTSAHFWGAAGYCNGIVSPKRTVFGESYSPEGIPQRVHTVWSNAAEREADLKRGIVESVMPLPHWEITQPGNVFRVFEKGSRLGGPSLGFNGAPTPLVGLPDKLEDPGRPNNRLSDRGLGTLNRVDLPILNLHKTRLNDPFLSFLGTNDNPGDYRSSGCTACHIVYANDRSPVHSGKYAAHGNSGRSFDPDPTIPKDQSGHPIRHEFTRSIPSSQCMVCHMHQPNAFVNSFYGYQMWSYETDGDEMWPKQPKHPTDAQLVDGLQRNPEEAATRGLWGVPKFLRDVSDLNPRVKHTQFADYHGHGWIFRAVFKMDRHGNLLDAEGKVIPYQSPDKFKGVIPRTLEEGRDAAPQDPHFSAESAQGGQRAVHLKDIHLERGMHCVDCHFRQDVHGNQKLFSEYQGAIEITCEDCHGTLAEYAKLAPSGPAAGTAAPGLGPITSFTDDKRLVTPFGKARFERKEGKVKQNLMLEDRCLDVPQVKDFPDNESHRLHGGKNITCQSCHTAWITSCFGCHLPQKANMRTPMQHFETKNLRNFASYNPQVARDDAFMLGIAPEVQGNKVSTVRSSSAVMISSEDGQRQKIYAQIMTMAANGMSSQAFNTHFAHTVRKTETRDCDDCHVSEADDNNAWLAQTLLLGTNFVNFVGYHAYVGCGEGGFHAVRATEWEEPQAVIGSFLHRLAYPASHRQHEERGRVLNDSVHHSGTDVRSLQLRGEYLYTACGRGGFRVYDVANVTNKGFSEKIVTSPVSPLGQDTHCPTAFATAVALPTNNTVSMSRVYRPENRETPYEYRGKVQNLHESYRYAYVTDREEGLLFFDVDCLSDGDPENNFVRRALTFNPGGALAGAENLAVTGATVYVCCARGVAVVDITDPLSPRILAAVGEPAVKRPRAIAIQFRYAFVCDEEGVKVLDVTFPDKMAAVPGAVLSLPGALDIYMARTYGYVAAGPRGLVVLDLERPRQPKVHLTWDADGAVNDLRQVKVAMTNDTVFAYLADGRNGLRVVQLISPEDAERTGRSAYGFSPRPDPKLIATFPTGTPALAVSKGLDRDRAVDESGHQVAVFGRIGGRPLNLEEMRRLYLKDGKLYAVTPKRPAAHGRHPEERP